MEDYKEKFIERTKKHIDLVNKYANKIGHIYLYHDYDKLSQLLDAYSLSVKYGGFDLDEERKQMTDEELTRYNNATIKHIISNPHHPEYFLNRADKERVINNFTRDNPPVNLDCSKMTKEGILEMCCDWCAMSEEFGNTPFEWLEKTCGYIKYDDYDPPKRWKFTNEQYDLIVNTLSKLWGDKEEIWI